MATPGWYPDPPGGVLLRYWDGTTWQQWAGASMPGLPHQGFNVDASGPDIPSWPHTLPTTSPPVRQGVTVVEGPNHGLHLALTLFTCGLWLPVWVIIAIDNKKRVRTYYR